MSCSGAGVVLCEPTRLYNVLTQCNRVASVLDENYLVLFDARERAAYDEAHVVLSRHAKKDDGGRYCIPFDVHLPSICHCVVYDSNTVSIVEETPAVKLAAVLAVQGCLQPVSILKGGYERFSAEYPFLRTEKICYSQKELACLPHYPSEVIPLSLYLGDTRHAACVATNAALGIRTRVHLAAAAAGEGTESSLPASLAEVSICVEDGGELLGHLEELCRFIDQQREKSERVLVFGEMGISRAATLVIAYLMSKNSWTLKEAFQHVRHCREHICPLQGFLEQLSQWEGHVLGQQATDITTLLY